MFLSFNIHIDNRLPLFLYLLKEKKINYRGNKNLAPTNTQIQSKNLSRPVIRANLILCKFVSARPALVNTAGPAVLSVSNCIKNCNQIV